MDQLPKKTSPVIKTVGNRVKLLRTKKKLTQAYMANMFGLTQSNYGRMEKDDRRINVIDLVKLCELLGTTTDYLLHGRKGKGRVPVEILQSECGNIETIIYQNKKNDKSI